MYACYKGNFRQEKKKFGVLAIYNMDMKNKYMDERNYDKRKTEEIKIRISRENKEKIKKMAEKKNISMSRYMTEKALEESEDILMMIPDAVRTWESYSEILYLVEKTHDRQLIKAVKEIIEKNMCEEK